MSALEQLHIQCSKRGWMLCLCGTYPQGKNLAGLVVNNLAIRRRLDGELLATAQAGPLAEQLDRAAVACAIALEKQGLIQ